MPFSLAFNLRCRKASVNRTAHFPNRTRRNIRSGRVSLLLVLSLLGNLALAGGLGYFALVKPQVAANSRAGSSDPAKSSGGIEALGRVQPTKGTIAVFGVPGDRILELKVGLGSEVAKDQPLAVLSGDKERQLGLDALKAQEREAAAIKASIEASRTAKLEDLAAEVAQAKAKAGSELAGLKAKIAIIEIQKGRADAEAARLQAIKSGNVVVSAQDLLQADALVRQAKEELRAANEQADLADKQMKAADRAAAAKGNLIEAETARALAQLPSDSLAASIKAAELKIASGTLKAPVGGRVVKLSVETGDTLTTMPVLQIADTEQISIIAEVYETRVAELRAWLAKAPGGTIRAEIDARVLGGNSKLTGTVAGEQIAPMIAKNSVFPLGPREDTDRRVVEVEVRLDKASSKSLAGYLGLQVKTRFLPPQ